MQIHELARAIETQADEEALFSLARAERERVYGKVVYIRGLIEITSYCKNNCYYCGIRRGNTRAARYRLTRDDILSCCRNGYALGFRTFVLQGGDDPKLSTLDVCDTVSEIKREFPDCAVTLSLGERSRADYAAYFEAGADRYLLRHETANAAHYARLHPRELSLEARKQCLYDLMDIGFQVGAGFMVGSPYQTAENLAEDILFITELKPHMIGIGPFIPHRDTPFRDFPHGSVQRTLYLIALLRTLCPNALIPATTALGTLDPCGREKGLLAGANVVMPNLSPPAAREKYMLYDNKLHTGAESAEHLDALARLIEKTGYKIAYEKGDYKHV